MTKFFEQFMLTKVRKEREPNSSSSTGDKSSHSLERPFLYSATASHSLSLSLLIELLNIFTYIYIYCWFIMRHRIWCVAYLDLTAVITTRKQPGMVCPDRDTCMFMLGRQVGIGRDLLEVVPLTKEDF